MGYKRTKIEINKRNYRKRKGSTMWKAKMTKEENIQTKDYDVREKLMRD